MGVLDRFRLDGKRLFITGGSRGLGREMALAIAEAGANVILFTTGRGTPLGFPVPTLKIASNAELADRKPAWIDFDASVVLGAGGFEAATAGLRDLVCATASGQPARNEINGEREMAIWKSGVTL